MPTDLVLLSLTALLAAIALAAAVMAVRGARRTTGATTAALVPRVPDAEPQGPPRVTALVPLKADHEPRPAPRQVDGRVVVPPTERQVVATALSRPQVRLAILLHGLTYALRPESRDRITALMRREYRRRRRERLAAGRRAVRAAHPTTQSTSGDAWMTEPWIGELPARPHSSTRVES